MTLEVGAGARGSAPATTGPGHPWRDPRRGETLSGGVGVGGRRRGSVTLVEIPNPLYPNPSTNIKEEGLPTVDEFGRCPGGKIFMRI